MFNLFNKRKRTVFFLHMPKTAGTTLEHYIEGNMQNASICPHTVMPQILPLSAKELAAFDLIHGHFNYNLLERLPKDTQTITMLRSPVARAISHLKHIRSNKSPTFWMKKYLPINDMTLDEMVQEEVVQKFICDYQLRRLAVDVNLNEFKEPMVLHTPFRLEQHHLDLGKKRLESFDAIGITERFSDSVKLLNKTFNWQEAVEIPSLNVSPTKDEISEKSIQKIKELTSLDQALYEHADAILSSRLI
jgi:hypothetical protein